MPKTLVVLCLALAACGGSEPPAEEPERGLRPGDPYPYTTPTPPRAPTPLDGRYVRTFGPEEAGPAGKCRRCPPYRPEESEQMLLLDRGTWRLTNEALAPTSIDWESVGHFIVEGGTITIFNDPNCTTTRGSYRWRLERPMLHLEVVEDECAFGSLRARYLTQLPWRAA